MSTIRIVGDGFVYKATEQARQEYRYLPGVCSDSDSRVLFADPDDEPSIPAFIPSLRETLVALLAASSTIVIIVFFISMVSRLLKLL